MRKSINLALHERTVDKFFRRILIISVIFFTVVVVVSLGLIIYRLILRSNFEALETKEQELNAQILQIVEKRDKFIETKQRLVDVSSIINKRAPTNERLVSLTSTIPISASINSLSGDSEELRISIESEDLASLNDLIEQRLVELGADTQKSILKVEMQSFGLNPSSLLYNATFVVTFQ